MGLLHLILAIRPYLKLNRQGFTLFQRQGGNMKKFTLGLACLIAAMTMSAQHAIACTDFRLTAKDGSVLISRSMEFAVDMQSNLRTSPRNRQITTTSNNKTPAMSWKAKYGYLYVDGFNQDVALDGMNEMGLSMEALYLPGEAQYQMVPAGKDSQSLPYIYFGDWVLGNFKSVDEVRQALSSIYVFEQTIPALGNMIFPLHFAIYDSTGKGIVVEFVKGKTNIFDNDVGVLTNSPTYDWQVTNLRNFVNLSPYNPTPIVANGLTFAGTGQGAGSVGLPGDVSPPSRFVKMSFMLKTTYPAPDATSAVNLAQHIINNVDIPAGLVRAVSNGKESFETTQWVVFKDLTHKVLYYRTYNDMSLRSIAMDKLNFTDTAPALKMPMSQAPTIIDMTTMFGKTMS